MATKSDVESHHLSCTNYLKHKINIESMWQLTLYLIPNNRRLSAHHSLNFKKRPITSISQEEWKKTEFLAQLIINILQNDNYYWYKNFQFVGNDLKPRKRPSVGIFRQKGGCSIKFPTASTVFEYFAFYTFKARRTKLFCKIICLFSRVISFEKSPNNFWVRGKCTHKIFLFLF